MCGIVAEVGAPDRTAIRAMLSTLRSRGPDDQACRDTSWYALGFCRLAIFQPQTGRQPVVSCDGTVTLVFNGEIYNYKDLKATLGPRVSPDIDSEARLLLALYMRHGQSFLGQVDGDFAIVIYDERRRICHVARDPVGVKPLYYAFTSDRRSVLLASEVRCFFAHPRFETGWDETAFAERDVLGFFDQRRTLFQNIQQVVPSTVFTIDCSADRISVVSSRYTGSDATSVDRPRWSSFTDLVGQCRERIRSAIRKRIMHSAVHPCTSAFSGGMDSSLIACIAAIEDCELINITLSDDSNSSDVTTAKDLADSMNLAHVIHAASVDHLRQHYVKIVLSMAACGPTYSPYILASAARQTCPDARVMLCGEGADELFLGYPLFLDPERFLSRAYDHVTRIDGRVVDASRLLRRLKRSGSGGGRRAMGSLIEMFRTDQLVARHLLPFDHGPMAFGIECRVPFLDRQLVQWVRQLPFAVLTKGGERKALLRALLDSILAPAVSDVARFSRRPKLAAPSSVAATVDRLVTDQMRHRTSAWSRRDRLSKFARSDHELLWLSVAEWALFERRGRVEPLGFDDAVQAAFASG